MPKATKKSEPAGGGIGLPDETASNFAEEFCEATPALWARFRLALEKRDTAEIEAAAKRLELTNVMVRFSLLVLETFASCNAIVKRAEGAGEEVDELREQLVVARRLRVNSIDEGQALAREIRRLECAARAAEARRSAGEQATKHVRGCMRACPEIFGIVGNEDPRKRLRSGLLPAILREYFRTELKTAPFDRNGDSAWLASRGQSERPRRRLGLFTRDAKASTPT